MKAKVLKFMQAQIINVSVVRTPLPFSRPTAVPLPERGLVLQEIFGRERGYRCYWRFTAANGDVHEGVAATMPAAKARAKELGYIEISELIEVKKKVGKNER